MKRRAFMAGLGGAAFASPLAAWAQQANKVHRVGFINPTIPFADMAGPNPKSRMASAFVHALRDLGYVEGKNLVLKRRSAEARPERIGEIAAEFVGLKLDVIVAGGGGTNNDVAQALKRVTSTVPIVMANSSDPVEAGLVASLARPGGNITGFTGNTGPEFEAKRLQLLKEAVPEATRLAYLGLKSDWEAPAGISVRAAARVLGVTLVHAEHTPTYYADAFALITRERLQALFAARNPWILASRQLIIDFAAEHRLPIMGQTRELVEAGGLMSYATSLTDLYRRAAGHVDKVLKGAKPADLPVEQPTKFELVINMRTAKALGLAIPPTLLAIADEVIE